MANSANLASIEQDEQAIRNLMATWHTATINGDSSQLLNLMAEDVIFLGPFPVVNALPTSFTITRMSL